MSTTNFFSTKDVYLASVLLAHGRIIVDMPKHEKQFTFIFDNSAGNIQGIVDLYWKGSLAVPDVKAIFTSYRDLRARMFN